MKITIEGTPEEIEKLLNAIAGSKEQLLRVESDIANFRTDLANS